jgi:uncharacterized protein (DUF885 family)
MSRLPTRGSTISVTLPYRAGVGLALGATLSMGACTQSQDTAPGGSVQLEAIVADMWAHDIETDVLERIQRGLPVTELPPVSFADAGSEAEVQRGFLSRLAAAERADLTLSEELTLEALLWETSVAVEGVEHFWLESFLTPYASHLRTLGLLYPALPLTTEEETQAYLALVRRLPAFITATEERARGQAERGIAVSRANLDNVAATWRAQAVSAEESMLWPSDQRLEGLAETDRAAFHSELRRLVDEEVAPAYRSLADYLEGPYRALAPEGVGLTRYPGGVEYYRYLTRLNTTMEVTPEEVQQVGRELLADLRRGMEEIRLEVGFGGTREEFHAMRRTDPRFFPESPDEVAERLKSAADSMWGRIHHYFEVTQQAPYGVRRLRADLEPTMTYGFYNPPSDADPAGYYNFNGSRLDERSWINLVAVGLHELIPGHHFHVARQMENRALPELRRSRRHTAYTEGWGSYASFLGLEAGVYQDPYSRYGLYALESFLATRLVVDPGMNYFGMTLEEGREFMRENTLESETQIATESLRYSTDIPGQALGYQMGKRMFVDLRARAEAAQGDAFQLSAFHEALMEHGSLPMIVLERRVDRWLDDRRAGGTP